MNNFRGTEKDLAMIKNAVRRVFSRSALRLEILNESQVSHSDSSRPRVKKWYKCNTCKQCFAGYEMQVDHIVPIVKINETLKEINVEELIQRTWCERSNLQAICLTDHKLKSKIENRDRRLYRSKINPMSTAHNNRKKQKKLIKKIKDKNREKSNGK